MKLQIIKDIQLPKSQIPQDVKLVTFHELAKTIKQGKILPILFKYGEVELQTYQVETLMKPFISSLMIRCLGTGKCRIIDQKGLKYEVTPSFIGKRFCNYLKEFFSISKVFKEIEKQVDSLHRTIAVPRIINLNLSESPLYIRTDLWLNVTSGGSVGHIAGVFNNLHHFTGKPILLSSDHIPTINSDFEINVIVPENVFWNFPEQLELPSLKYNGVFMGKAEEIMENRRFSFVYQRYSLNNFSGVQISRILNIPFILEYNGSEIWINRNWGNPLKYEKLSERIEMLNMKAADLIVVVSKPMKDELVSRGIDDKKILVNPNGVNTDLYHPEVDGSRIREQYNLDDKTVIGFIGTFGKWHGAEVLTEAYGKLLTQHPRYRDETHLLMIGDGITMPEVKRKIQEYSIGVNTILTGIVPQEKGPHYLAACDILASPHVPNPDGTPFFGSPTKLFEYLAMGKGIVASRLDQVGEILQHNDTAWMVEPGSVDSLVEGLKTLLDDAELRVALGKAARNQALERHTWKKHTEIIIEMLKTVILE